MKPTIRRQVRRIKDGLVNEGAARQIVRFYSLFFAILK
jgi:hypothetical protein